VDSIRTRTPASSADKSAEPIEPSWQAIKQWIPAADDQPSFHWQDTHHSKESSWKPMEVALGDDRIRALDAD
jgi:hypothetical protein